MVGSSIPRRPTTVYGLYYCQPTHFSPPSAPNLTAAAAKAAFREQAAADWSLILAHRANEMKSGAEFVCVNFATDEEGQFLGHTRRTEDSMHHSFARHWQQMADEGLLQQEEVLATNFPNQYRTLEEVSRPFASGVTSPAAEAGLQLREARTEVVECPYLNTWLADPTAINGRCARGKGGGERRDGGKS
jgi:hypothetical protein